MADSYQAVYFEANIKRIANYADTNVYDASSIRYVIIKLKKPVLDIPDDCDEITPTKTQISIW